MLNSSILGLLLRFRGKNTEKTIFLLFFVTYFWFERNYFQIIIKPLKSKPSKLRFSPTKLTENLLEVLSFLKRTTKIAHLLSDASIVPYL